jgi:hypothetical protein
MSALPEAQADVLDSIRAGIVTMYGLMADTGRTYAGVRSALTALRRAGHIVTDAKVPGRANDGRRACSWRLADAPPRATAEGRPPERERRDLLWGALRLWPDGASVASICMACAADDRAVRHDLARLRQEGRARWNGQRGTGSRWFAILPSEAPTATAPAPVVPHRTSAVAGTAGAPSGGGR